MSLLSNLVIKLSSFTYYIGISLGALIIMLGFSLRVVPLVLISLRAPFIQLCFNKFIDTIALSF